MAKSKKVISQSEAEKMMLEVNDLDKKLVHHALAEADAIAKVRKLYRLGKNGIRLTGLEQKKAELEKKLNDYADADRGNWRKKSLNLSGGVMGFRVNPCSVSLIKSIAKNEKDAAANTFTLYRPFVSRILVLDKEAIRRAFMCDQLDEAKLRECGLKVKQGEGFFLKSNCSDALEKAQEILKKA